jgi:hypothetical protein
LVPAAASRRASGDPCSTPAISPVPSDTRKGSSATSRASLVLGDARDVRGIATATAAAHAADRFALAEPGILFDLTERTRRIRKIGSSGFVPVEDRPASELQASSMVRSARPRMESRWSLWHIGVAPTWAVLGFVAIVLPGSVAAPAPLRCATVFCLGRPSESRVQSFLKQQRAKPFNHAFVGTTRFEGTAPAAPARSLFPATLHAWQRSSEGNSTTHTAGILLQLGRERVWRRSRVRKGRVRRSG